MFNKSERIGVLTRINKQEQQIIGSLSENIKQLQDKNPYAYEDLITELESLTEHLVHHIHHQHKRYTIESCLRITEQVAALVQHITAGTLDIHAVREFKNNTRDFASYRVKNNIKFIACISLGIIIGAVLAGLLTFGICALYGGITGGALGLSAAIYWSRCNPLNNVVSAAEHLLEQTKKESMGTYDTSKSLLNHSS